MGLWGHYCVTELTESPTFFWTYCFVRDSKYLFSLGHFLNVCIFWLKKFMSLIQMPLRLDFPWVPVTEWDIICCSHLLLREYKFRLQLLCFHFPRGVWAGIYGPHSLPQKIVTLEEKFQSEGSGRQRMGVY